MDRSTLPQNHVDPTSDLKRPTKRGLPECYQEFSRDTEVIEDGG